jgi:hypothetical protein
MWDNIIGKHIRRCNRNLLIVTSVGILGWLLVFCFLVIGDCLNWEITLVFLLGSLFAVYNFYKVAKRRANPGIHPIVLSLKRFGIEPLDVVTAIESEAALMSEINLGETSQRTSIQITPTWLLIPRTFGLDIFRLSELTWAYVKVTTYRLNFVIPVGKSHVAVLCFYKTTVMPMNPAKVFSESLQLNYRFFPKRLEISGNEKEIRRLLEKIWIRAPWVFIGFDRELEQLWKYNPSAVFLAAQERRRQFIEKVEEE